MAKEKAMFMAIDQYGNCEHGLVHPRKDLMARMGIKHAAKMYEEVKDRPGDLHVGYVVGHRWFRVYEVVAWHGKR